MDTPIDFDFIEPLFPFNQSDYIKPDESKLIGGFCLPLALECAYEYLYNLQKYNSLEDMFCYLKFIQLPTLAKSQKIREYMIEYIKRSNKFTSHLNSVDTMLNLTDRGNGISTELLNLPENEFLKDGVVTIICKHLNDSNVFLINSRLNDSGHAAVLIYDKKTKYFYFFDANYGVYRVVKVSLAVFFKRYIDINNYVNLDITLLKRNEITIIEAEK